MLKGQNLFVVAMMQTRQSLFQDSMPSNYIEPMFKSTEKTKNEIIKKSDTWKVSDFKDTLR